MYRKEKCRLDGISQDHKHDEQFDKLNKNLICLRATLNSNCGQFAISQNCTLNLRAICSATRLVSRTACRHHHCTHPCKGWTGEGKTWSLRGRGGLRSLLLLVCQNCNTGAIGLRGSFYYYFCEYGGVLSCEKWCAEALKTKPIHKSRAKNKRWYTYMYTIKKQSYDNGTQRSWELNMK